ncbi:WhiB family transcriptional regulator [Kineococcus rhizosphaerae]|uniref:WhiB family transcriptional regulator n=1 Tax=Kineococcus rhizosphaerae TaxID=559628 RepID=UPI000D05884E
MRVHWSVQSASRDAILRQVNVQRAASLLTRRVACEADPELFFDDAPTAQREAQRMCWDCPVRRSCLLVGLEAEANAQTSNGTYSNGTIGGVTAAVREPWVRARRARRTGRRAAVSAAGAAKAVPGALPTPSSRSTSETTSRTGTQHAGESAVSPTWTNQAPHMRRSA